MTYPDDCWMPTADLLTIKLLLNSVISTNSAKFMSMDINSFYLNTPFKHYEYLWLKLEDVPKDVAKHYELEDKPTEEGWVYVKKRKSMYGLPQTGLLAQELL